MKKQLESIIVNEDGSVFIPAETYAELARIARKKYEFKGLSERTVKKYVKQLIEESITEYTVEVDNKYLPKKKEGRDA